MRLEEELKTAPIKDPYQRMMLNILLTNYWMEDQMSAIMKRYALSKQQYNVLRILKGQKGNPINLSDIQERMMHKRSNATRLVEKLRKKGLVERVLCEENRRKVEITITQPGLELLKEVNPEIEAADHQLAQSLSKEEAVQLSDLLEKLRS
ncbi:MAG: MarR family transcriptional regulator [Bacteroidota bacterium]